jgi:hypothetical protein
MSDKEIPKICRNCMNCERYIEVGVFMPDWAPWKWRCKADKYYHNCEDKQYNEKGL